MTALSTEACERHLLLLADDFPWTRLASSFANGCDLQQKKGNIMTRKFPTSKTSKLRNTYAELETSDNSMHS